MAFGVVVADGVAVVAEEGAVFEEEEVATAPVGDELALLVETDTAHYFLPVQVPYVLIMVPRGQDVGGQNSCTKQKVN